MNRNEKAILIRSLDQLVAEADARRKRALAEGGPVAYAVAQAGCDSARDLRSDLRHSLNLDDDDSPEADL